MNNPLISIIIPVYNTEKYLRKCLDSVVAQTYTNWECLLIDDGSTDSSGAICDEYASTDNRFRVFHKENGGVSSAREYGLKNVSGKYLIHADPDDWVDPNMLHILVARAEQDNADMVICDFYINKDENQIYRKQEPSSLNHYNVLSDLFTTLHGSCWNKLVKKDACVKANAHFPVGINYCEDFNFNVQLLKLPLKIIYESNAFYHYFQHPASITNNYTRGTFLNRLKSFENLKNVLIGVPNRSILLKKMKAIIFIEGYMKRVLKEEEVSLFYKEKMLKYIKGKRPFVAYIFSKIGLYNLSNFVLTYRIK